MTYDELMEQLIDPAQFDQTPNSEQKDLLGKELQAILQWLMDRPRPQPDAWESFYLAAAIGQLAAQNLKTAFSCSRQIFAAIADRHPLIGMPPTTVQHLERALAAAWSEGFAAHELAEEAEHIEHALFRGQRFPVAA